MVPASPRLVTVEEVRRSPFVQAFLKRTNEQMKILGYTEHGERHASLVANIAHNILERLGRPKRQCELAAMAGYFHDIGNVVHREMHAQSSAIIAMNVLQRLEMDDYEIALVMGAIGNHEEERGDPVSEIAAAVSIADKSDVHRSRVQNPDFSTFDIHDRVNYAAQRSFVRVNNVGQTITLEIDIDTEYAQVMDYFEIFLSRMVMARRAAQFLGAHFELKINGTRLL
ncbi:MAG: phosphohydrolase [Chloroflexi bacterium RBG_16_57_9]|nr:MAG: phosphohydrolase [Chloroflexi bacterium RBG_16_57_9]